MIDAAWVKRHIKAGKIGPVDGVTMTNPRWEPPYTTRQLWDGEVAGFRVSLYPKGREIDMSTVRVRALDLGEEA